VHNFDVTRAVISRKCVKMRLRPGIRPELHWGAHCSQRSPNPRWIYGRERNRERRVGKGIERGRKGKEKDRKVRQRGRRGEESGSGGGRGRKGKGGAPKYFTCMTPLQTLTIGLNRSMSDLNRITRHVPCACPIITRHKNVTLWSSDEIFQDHDIAPPFTNSTLSYVTNLQYSCLLAIHHTFVN